MTRLRHVSSGRHRGGRVLATTAVDESTGREFLTIDGLAARAGVPSRTIRFYQTQGALPPSQRQGRIALYTEEHVERLKLIELLQSRGLRLSAIVDLVRRDPQALSVSQWLGLDAGLAAPWSEDEPELLTHDQLLERIAPRGEAAIPTLEAIGMVSPHRDSGEVRYRVPSPALLRVTLQLDDAGVELETAGGAGFILSGRLAPAADELVRYFAEHAGRGFGRHLSPEELTTALNALRPLGAEAVRLIFAREMERAIRVLLDGGDGAAPRRHRPPARRSPRRQRASA